MNMSKSRFLLVFFALIMLGLTGCTQSSSVRDCSQSDCNFYQGTQGIETRLLSQPGTLFYHSDRAFDEDAGNEISLNLQVTNKGVSDSFGAVFVSGFGRSFVIEREGVGVVDTRGSYGGCKVRFAGGLENFRVDCPQFGSGGTDWRGGGGLDLRLGNIFDELGWDSYPGWAPESLGVFRNQGGEWTFDVDFMFDNLALFFHGKILVLISDNINFENLGGMEFRLRGFNPETKVESQDYNTFHIKMDGQWPAGSDTFNPQYNIRTCYGYSTFASPDVCVDPQPNNGEEKNCQGNVQRSLGSQGSPVAITRLDQVNTGRTVEMVFTIENLGRGDVWDVASLERCSPYFLDNSPSAPYKDKIYVGFAELEGVPLQCDRDEIRLNNGRGQLRCTYDVSMGASAVRDAYVAPLRMELWYGYEENIGGTLNIRRAS